MIPTFPTDPISCLGCWKGFGGKSPGAPPEEFQDFGGGEQLGRSIFHKPPHPKVGTPPPSKPQPLGNTLSPAAGWGVCSRATATCLVGPGWPAWHLRGPFIHRAAMLAFQVDTGLEFPRIALGAPVTTYPEAQDRAPGLCCARVQGYHLCFGQMQPPSVSRTLGVLGGRQLDG